MASKISTNARFKLPRKDSMKKMQKNLRRGAPKIKENSLTKLKKNKRGKGQKGKEKLFPKKAKTSS